MTETVRGWNGVFLGVLSTIDAAMERRVLAIRERFWGHVDIRTNIDECWTWKRSLTGGGYGQFHIEGLVFKAHRVAYEFTIGPIPDGLVLDHLCRNRACVNPWHMEPITQQENTLRGDRAAMSAAQVRRHRARTHCRYGHKMTPENTYSPPKQPSSRTCRTCRNDRSREANQRKKADAA